MMSFSVARVVVILFLLGGCNSKYVKQDTSGERQFSIEDFTFLAGSWDGTLEYLNYGDDESFVTLPTRAVFSLDGDKIAYRFVYTEPGGEEVDGRGSIEVKAGSSVFFNGASHRLVNRSADIEKGTFEVKISRQGQDNDRDARIDHVIQRNEDAMSITRYILLEGASAPFVRHTYTFSLVK